ncbi:MAG TPA: DUF1080 domain-containing protein [Gemmatales bacterium]|nr:DUF1080 domain-containing protein [Gemmatales bacterium]HMP59872.1 DUF1080 domain-containing protein [Gemmatales bacterium]
MFLWLCALCLWSPLPAAAQADEWQPLWNGQDLAGWRVVGGRAEVWRVDGDVLVANGSGGGWLMTEQTYSDFVLELEFKIPEMGNSGVAIRAPTRGNPAFDGMEIQILDDRNYLDETKYKGLKPTQRTGAIYDVVPPSADATRPAGEWNTMRITAQGPKVKVELNGTTIVNANLDEHLYRAEKGPENPGEAHPGLGRSRGHIGLQSHDGRIEFRKVRIKKLAGEP